MPFSKHVLGMHLQAGAVQPLLGVVVGGGAGVAEAGEHIGHVEERIPTLLVVPDVDRLVALDDRERADPSAPAIGAVLVGDAHVAALVVPLPAVEWGLDDLALDVAAVAEMGAQVFAVGVHHGELADGARQAIRSRPKYFIRCTSPIPISSDHATWNQPVGFMDKGGLAMP